MISKNKILLFLKGIINKIQNANAINLQKGSSIGNNFVAYNSELKGLLNIGSNVSCGNSILQGKIKIGSNTQLSSALISGEFEAGETCKIINGVTISGRIKIGSYTSLNGPNTDFTAKVNEIHIGNFCSIARNVTFQEFNHNFSKMTSYYINNNLKKTGIHNDIVAKGVIKLEHDVWIGTHCVVLSGVTIGTGAVIAANSVVTNDIPPYAIAAGTPAKVIKYRFNESTIKFLLESEWWNMSKEEVIKFYDEFKAI
jgi:virginiamycin A acetyltransferase